jgi:hypothetical protein
MKTVALILVILSVFSEATFAGDYDQIPAEIRKKIKSKCVSSYPDDYSIQRGCISLQSDAYLDVHGGDTPPADTKIDLTGIPSAVDIAQINNAAYLSVAKAICKIDTGIMVAQYVDRAIASDRLNAGQVEDMVAGQLAERILTARRDKKTFCAEAKRNLPNFVSDLLSK